MQNRGRKAPSWKARRNARHVHTQEHVPSLSKTGTNRVSLRGAPTERKCLLLPRGVAMQFEVQADTTSRIDFSNEPRSGRGIECRYYWLLAYNWSLSSSPLQDIGRWIRVPVARCRVQLSLINTAGNRPINWHVRSQRADDSNATLSRTRLFHYFGASLFECILTGLVPPGKPLTDVLYYF